jgi:hypothetical protein
MPRKRGLSTHEVIHPLMKTAAVKNATTAKLPAMAATRFCMEEATMTDRFALHSSPALRSGREDRSHPGFETPLNRRTTPRYQGHHKKNQEDKEQDFGDFGRQARDAYESQYTGYDSDN